MRVLFIDDQEDFLQLAKLIIQRIDQSFKVTTTVSTKEALSILKNKEFDAIVCDFDIPEMNGLDFLNYIRKHEITLPFILFTGKGREEIAMKAINLGANRYFMKGIDMISQFSLLVHEISQLVEYYQNQKAYKRSEQEKSLILENVSESISYLDKKLKIVWTNRSAINFVDKPNSEIVGKYCYESWFNSDEICENCPASRSMKSKKIEKSILIMSDGSYWLLKGIPIFNNQNNTVGALETAFNLTEMKNMHRLAIQNDIPILKVKNKE